MKVYGIILAGGKSSRMGVDKAGLIWQGQTLLERIFLVMRDAVGEGSVFVSGDRPGYPHVVDEFPDNGPIEGVRAVLRKLSASSELFAVVVCPVDMPRMNADVLSLLIKDQSRADVVKFSGFELPAMFNYSARLLEILEGICMPGQSPSLRSFRNLYTALSVHELSDGSVPIFANTNTKEEWNEAVSTTNHSPAG